MSIPVVGQSLGRNHILGQLGEGGMSTGQSAATEGASQRTLQRLAPAQVAVPKTKPPSLRERVRAGPILNRADQLLTNFI